MPRCFLALPIGEVFEGEVAPYLGALRDANPDIKWLTAGQIHLTLHFFGNISAEEIPKINAFMNPLVSKHPAIELSLFGLGAFPSPKFPRVLWLGVQGNMNGLRNLHRAAAERILEHGFQAEGRPFSPHVTIGRTKDTKVSLTEIQARVENWEGTSSRRIRAVHLCESRLRSEGAVYSILHRYPFRNG